MKRVLFVDDDKEILERLKEDFTANNIEVLLCSNSDEATRALDNDVYFDAVILDWFFEAEDSSLSRLFLKRLKTKHFRPVFIFTSRLYDYEQTSATEIGFPSNLLKGVDKETSLETLRNEINTMFQQNISLQLASAYRNKIKSSIEDVLFELNELPNAHLAAVLKKVIGNEQNVDWGSDLILNLIHRQLLADDQFVTDLTHVLNTMPANLQNIGDADKRSLINKILYFKPKSAFIRNGDIVKITNENNSNETFGVIVTPDCDLVQPKTRFLEIIELRFFNDASINLNAEDQRKVKKYQHDTLHFFPSVKMETAIHDFVAVLKSKIIAEEVVENNPNRYPLASRRLLYSHSFRVNSTNVRIDLICGKSNPYKSDFLQKLNSNNSRVGIPDIKDILQ